MKKKIKAEFFNPTLSSDEKVRDDISMTPQQRLSLAFRLADIALEIRKGQIPPSKDENIIWHELKIKNGKARKRIQKSS